MFKYFFICPQVHALLPQTHVEIRKQFSGVGSSLSFYETVSISFSIAILHTCRQLSSFCFSSHWMGSSGLQHRHATASCFSCGLQDGTWAGQRDGSLDKALAMQASSGI